MITLALHVGFVLTRVIKAVAGSRKCMWCVCALGLEQPHRLEKKGNGLVACDVSALRCTVVYTRARVSREGLKGVVDVDVDYSSFRGIRW